MFKKDKKDKEKNKKDKKEDGEKKGRSASKPAQVGPMKRAASFKSKDPPPLMVMTCQDSRVLPWLCFCFCFLFFFFFLFFSRLALRFH